MRKAKSKKIYDGKILKLYLEEATLPNRAKTKIESVKHQGAVAILPFASKNKIVLIRQYRPVIGKYIYEIPAGTLEKGETPSKCAARELTEEIGYNAKKLKRLHIIYPAPGYSTEILHLYTAHDLTYVGDKKEPDELINAEMMSFNKALRLIEKGLIVDAKTLISLLLVK
jgi:ADP-ribose pyrophosphatase